MIPDSISGGSLPPLPREEVENLLPDYAFGQLTDEDKVKFEAALPAYPDLAQELLLIRESFEEVDKEQEAEAKVVSQRLKNLTVHVQERLHLERERRAHRLRLFRFFVPALATCAVIAVVSIPRGFTEYLFTRSAGADSGFIFRAEESINLSGDEKLAAELNHANMAFTDNSIVNVNDKEILDRESLLAAGLLQTETLNALAYNKSAFRDYFDNASDLHGITDEEVAQLAKVLTEM